MTDKTETQNMNLAKYFNDKFSESIKKITYTK